MQTLTHPRVVSPTADYVLHEQCRATLLQHCMHPKGRCRLEQQHAVELTWAIWGSHLLHGALEIVVRGVAILLRHVAPRKAGRRLRSRLVEALVVARRWQAGSLISSSHWLSTLSRQPLHHVHVVTVKCNR